MHQLLPNEQENTFYCLSEENKVKHLIELTKSKHVDEIKTYLMNLSVTTKGKVFELYVKELYEGNGFMAVRKGGKNDGGADILLYDPRNPQKVVSIVQAKNHKRPLTVDDTALELYKFDTIASKKYNCKHYKLISVSGFVADAEDEEKFQVMQQHLNIALHGWSYVEELIRTYDPNNICSPHIDLHAHNKIAYEHILSQWETSNRVAAVQATGTGKSFLIAKCLSDFVDKKKIVLTPSNFILKQLTNKFPWIVINTTFMTYQKLALLPIEEIEQMDLSLIVLDEFHRIGAEKWGEGVSKIVHHHANAKILGTSATPIRFLDGNRDMSDEFFENNVANNLSLADAIVQKILPTPKYVSAIYTLDKEIEYFKEKIASSENSKEEKQRLLQQLNQLSINWENTHGIEHILNKHICDEKKFIVFCENKSHLEEMEVLVENWFRKAKLNKRIRKFRVMSGNKHNKQELNEFVKGEDKDFIYLLFSIDMLNEGLHIEDVDGVILLRKTSSPIIFYQQIGRAMDTSKMNNPLIFDLVNNFSTIQSNNFVNELKRAEMKLNTIRSRLGLSNVNLDFGCFISDETVEAQQLFEQLENELLNTWNVRYQELLKYKDVHGNCLVPSKYKSNKKLATWVEVQRRDFKKGVLLQNKINKLNSIGFIWDVLETKWNEMFSLLCEYRMLHGDCLVPQKYVENQELVRWVLTQRHHFKKGILTQEKIDKLNTISFSWNPYETKWEEMFALLSEYQMLHGDCLVPKSYEPNKELARWIISQRTMFKKGSLSQDKIDKLNAIGMVWRPLETKWNKMFTLLCEYKQFHGDCFVPTHYELNEELSSWIHVQRRHFKKGILPQEKIDKLNTIGFVWDVLEAKWEEMFLLYSDYKIRHGNRLVSKKLHSNKKIISWVSNQRHEFKKGELSQYKIEKLNAIGFLWEVHETKWDEMFTLLCEYKMTHGDCLVRGDSESIKELMTWSQTQRINFKKGQLSANKIDKLNSIDFAWDFLDARWSKMFDLLCEYQTIHGDCLVPLSYETNKELARWVITQRQMFKKSQLSHDKIDKLNAIGFDWNPLDTKWNEMFNALCDYKKVHGNCSVIGDCELSKALVNWVDVQRQTFKKDKLSQDKINKLNSIGFIWNPYVKYWKEMFTQLLEYKTLHGDCLVPRDYKLNKDLAEWVSRQRQSFKKEKLSQDKIDRLNEIGFAWDGKK